MRRVAWVFGLALASVVQFISLPAKAEFPARSIEIVVPAGAGGGLDSLARVVQPLLERELKQVVKVTNVPGNGQVNGITYTLNGPADGHLIHCGSQSGIIAESLGKIPFRFNEAFAPLARFQHEHGVLWKGNDSRFNSASEFIAFSRNNPGTVKIGVSSLGGADEAAIRFLASGAGIKPRIVEYGSLQERLSALNSKDVDVIYEEASAVGELAKSGALRPLLVLSDNRLESSALLAVPAAAELDVKGWSALGTWRGFMVRKETPAAVADKLVVALRRVYASHEYKKWAAESFLDTSMGWLERDAFALQWRYSFLVYQDFYKQLQRSR